MPFYTVSRFGVRPQQTNREADWSGLLLPAGSELHNDASGHDPMRSPGAPSLRGLLRKGGIPQSPTCRDFLETALVFPCVDALRRKQYVGWLVNKHLLLF